MPNNDCRIQDAGYSLPPAVSMASSVGRAKIHRRSEATVRTGTLPHPMAITAPQRPMILACCLGLILQLPGVASAVLACGCILPGRTCCCSTLANAATPECCGCDEADLLPDCFGLSHEDATQPVPRPSEQQPCPCWQALTQRLAALPSSTRFHHEPDSNLLVWNVARVDIDPVLAGGQRDVSSPVPVQPRWRLQSLLCVWII